MYIPAPTIALILAMLAAPSIAQRRLLSDQQAALMVNGAVSQTDVANIGEEAMVESIVPTIAIPTNSTRPPAQPTPPQTPAKPILPITVMLYTSSPGPKECRGTPVFSLNIPKGDGISTPQGPTCYNVTLAPQAECGTFMANKEDGCQARIFSDRGCTNFLNLAVFLDEVRPVGGIIKSVEVRCGIKSADPKPLSLNLPPVQKPQR